MTALLRLLSTLTALADRLILIVLCAGGLEILLAGDGGSRVAPLAGRVVEHAQAHPWASATLLFVLLALNLSLPQFLAWSASRAPSRSFIVSRTPGGKTRVALSALRRALAATAAQVPEIARARVRVQRTGRGRYRVHVRYLLRDVHHSASAAERLRLVVKKRFSELVVLEPSDRVVFDLDLGGIVRVADEPVTPSRRPGVRELSAPDGFQGPVYPVEGDLP